MTATLERRDYQRERIIAHCLPSTQTQIAHRLGVSQMHISRLLAKTLARLRDGLD